MAFGLSRSILGNRGKNRVIAEIKPFSPTRGDLLNGRNPFEILKQYEDNGAIAISYITEKTHFRGNKRLFAQICELTELPVLRKDFIVSRGEIEDTAQLGGSAVLLIARILQWDLAEMVDVALSQGIDPVIEIHHEDELHYLRDIVRAIVGINNRDISNVERDDGSINVTRRIAPIVPKRFLKITESGIWEINQLRELLQFVDAALIGTSLMVSPDPGTKLREFVGV